MKIFRVAVDLDNTVWNLVDPWLQAYFKLTHERIKPEDIKTYSLKEYVTYPEILPEILELPDFWNHVELYDGVYEAIEHLCENPAIDLVIATATSYRVGRAKFDRLFELLPMLDESQLIVTSRKDLLDVDFLVDDWEENLRHTVHDSHTQPILITQPYNEALPESIYRIKRARSLVDAVDAIEKYVNANMFD